MRSPADVLLAADVDQVGKIDDADLAADRLNPFPPILVVHRVGGDGIQTAVVTQAIAAQRFELVHEQAFASRPFRQVGGFVAEDFDGDPHIEAAPLVLGRRNDVGLVGGEIVRQAAHGRRHHPAVPQFGQEKVDRHGQLGGGQQFVAGLLQQVLQRKIFRQPFAQHAKQVGLFDVLFAFEHGAVRVAAGTYVFSQNGT